jgi:hypothetical protein
MTGTPSETRKLRLAGLLNSLSQTQEIIAARVLYNWMTTPAAPHIWVPKLTLPQAALVGAAAAVINNPVVTRRFWAGWKL